MQKQSVKDNMNKNCVRRTYTYARKYYYTEHDIF